MALLLTLMVLLILTGLVLALLSASAFEPQISHNHSHTVRARYVAEAGLEYAYDVLATNAQAWDSYLVGATCSQGTVLGAPESSLPGLGVEQGTFTVTVRNDCNAGDSRLTGVGLDTTTGGCGPAAAGAATRDANCRVIVTSAGTIRTLTRTISAVVSKTVLPTINGALGFPGLQAAVSFTDSGFVIDGRDTRLGDRPGAPTGVAAPVYGIALNGSLPVLETQVEKALESSQPNDVIGRDETGASAATRGANAIRADGVLTAQAVADFLAAVRTQADVIVTTGPGNTHAVRNLGAACSTGSGAACWGTVDAPRIVYVGNTTTEADAPQTALEITGDSHGAGILIIENGRADISGSFRWNGLVIVTGRNVGIRYLGGGPQSIYGAVIVNELRADAATNLEGVVGGKAGILYSREALDAVQNGLKRRLVTTYGWTER